MRRAVKDPASAIITGNLNYISNNSTNNKRIVDILLGEQKMFCAYTDEYISRSDAKDIEHFNPTLKDTDQDNYNNWFVVKHQWNMEKSEKWDKFQPVLHPTALDFEERIVYIQGDYVVKKIDDIEAKNLSDLLKLDDIHLANNRKKYIARKRDEIALDGNGVYDFFATLMNADPCQIKYTRAIKEEFGIDILEMIN